MKNARYIILSCIIAVAACTRESIPTVDDSCRVYIAASLQDNLHTKTPYVPSFDDDMNPDVPTSKDPLSVEVWASSVPWMFSNRNLDGTQYDPVNNPGVPYEVAYHTTAHFQSGGPQLLAEMIYSKIDTPPIYFIAMSPNSGWDTTDGKSATYKFSGHEDVMFAPQVDGSYGKKDSFGNPVWPVLHFHHLLTWLRLEIIAENEDVADVWGKIKDITITGNNSVTIDLSKSYNAANVTFTGETDMPFYANGTNEVFPASDGFSIPFRDMEEVAYMLCAPVQALVTDTESEDRVPEYTLNILTENRSIAVPIDLKTAPDKWYEGSTMGMQFTLSLTFRMGNNITTGVVVKDWISEGVSGGNLYE